MVDLKKLHILLGGLIIGLTVFTTSNNKYKKNQRKIKCLELWESYVDKAVYEQGFPIAKPEYLQVLWAFFVDDYPKARNHISRKQAIMYLHTPLLFNPKRNQTLERINELTDEEDDFGPWN